MGIGPDTSAMIRTLPLEAGFSVCELGNQVWHMGNRRLWRRSAVELYREIGCGSYQALDSNGQDGALVVDLNKGLDFQGQRKLLIGQFDLVTDFGTSEHIFEIGQAWRTMHALCKPGGIIAFLKPYQGHREHCFYNVHENFFRDLAEANGYTIQMLRLIENTSGDQNWLGWLTRPFPAKDFVTPHQGKYRRINKL